MPPRGSAQDNLLEEIHRRERSERLAFASLFARIVGRALHVRDDYLETMLSAYKDELTQVTYTPEYRKKQRERKKATTAHEARKKAADDELLKKLDRLTVKDDDMPSPKKVGARRK